ncbi:MAG: hypothetical protein JRJ59_12490, partial [Deltaproteobacteria bacterium]|nr:hypothetical protein [Deltaproteobacteria bacterium]
MDWSDVKGNSRSFLAKLNQATNGDEAVTVSMYDLGADLGLDKETARLAAEDLIGWGLVEIKSLGGGVSITAQGLAAVNEAGGASAPESGRGSLFSERLAASGQLGLGGPDLELTILSPQAAAKLQGLLARLLARVQTLDQADKVELSA